MGNIWSTNNNRRRESAYYQNPPVPHPNFYTTDPITLPPPPPPPPSNPSPPPANYYHVPGATPSYPYPPQPPPPPPLPPPPYNSYYHSHQYHHMMGRYNYPPQTYMYAGHGNGGWLPGFRPGFTVHSQPPYVEPAPYVEHQEAKKIKNDVNVHKDTLKVEIDEANPGRYLISFVFDAKVDGSITIIYFAKEERNCRFSALFPESHAPCRYPFEKGLGQKFTQPSGAGIDLGFFEMEDLSKPSPDEDVFPLVVVAESHLLEAPYEDGSTPNSSGNMQITQAVFEKGASEPSLQVKVIRQILWVDGERYELREIYGIASTSAEGYDDSDPGKECVICMTEPKDTAILPCRHMCLCSDCAKALRLQSNKCPICRQPIEKLIEIRINGDVQ